MRTFKDNGGREWTVEITVATLKRVRGLTGTDLMQVVEGAGGWRVPLNHAETLAGLARRLGFPVVLVVGLRLGCINHALLTAEAIRADGLELAGWVANHVDPGMSCPAENLATLDAMLGAPRLGVIPWRTGIDARAAAGLLDIGRLCRGARD